MKDYTAYLLQAKKELEKAYKSSGGGEIATEISWAIERLERTIEKLTGEERNYRVGIPEDKGVKIGIPIEETPLQIGKRVFEK